MLALAWLCAERRSTPNMRIILWGIASQFILGLLILRTAFGEALFTWVRAGFDVITAASTAGAEFVFGNLSRFFLVSSALVPGPDGNLAPTEPFAINAVIAFNVLPVIIFVSALAAILLHLGVTQRVVRAMAFLMRRTLKTSGAETTGMAILVFLGIESVSVLGNYLNAMTRSEIFTLMVGFLATIAASVMVAYAGFGAEPGHLLAASLMSAPAAIVIAKILVPETGTPKTLGPERIVIEVESQNIFDATSRGASLGLNIALNVAALLIVFIGLIYLLDLATLSVTGQSITTLLGWCFRPFAFLMGIPLSDIPVAAELLATKSVFNEFLAYEKFQPLIQQEAISPRTKTIVTYALCGFANPGSLGIMIGALAGMVPERRSEVAQLSVRAFIGGTLACFTTACVAGILT
jgi:CNT family concentrative nucleoside transporter